MNKMFMYNIRETIPDGIDIYHCKGICENIGFDKKILKTVAKIWKKSLKETAIIIVTNWQNHSLIYNMLCN